MHASSPHYGDALSENPRVRAMRAGANAARLGYGLRPPGTDPRLAPPGTSQAEWDEIGRGYERMQQSIDHLPPEEQDRFWHPWRYQPREESPARPSSPDYGDIFGQRGRRLRAATRRIVPHLVPGAMARPPVPSLPPPTPPPPGTIAAQAITPVLRQPNYGGPGSPYAHLNPVLGSGYSVRALQTRYQGQSMTGHIWVGEAMAVHELTKIILALTAPITGDYLRFWAPIGLLAQLTPTRLGNGYLGSAWAVQSFID